jgi:hypothetical protein
MNRLLVAAIVAASVVGPMAPSAHAGPLRDKIKSVLKNGKSDAGGLLRAGAAVTRCVLKGKGKTVIC